MITYEDFEKVEIRVGKIIKIDEAGGLRNPAYQMTIDFGKELGTKVSLGQYTKNYTKDELVEKLVICVVNFPPKQIGEYSSEALTLGFKDDKGDVVLAIPEKDVPLGERMY